MASDQSSQSQSTDANEQVGISSTDSNKHATRVADIQRALKDAGLDGWLFYDFRKSDPLAYRILLLDQNAFASRRWAYYIPANGQPVKIVHRIEQEKLDELPGRTLVYLRWQQLHAHLRNAVGLDANEGQAAENHKPRIAMQYSPNNNIPYVSRVDAGTVELVRSFGAEPETSADLVQVFEAVWTSEQKEMHDTAADNIHRIILEAFKEIARRIRASETTTEYDIQQFILQRFEDAGMTSDNDPPIVAVNANSASPHYGPTSKRHSPIKSGDFVLLDVWAKLKKPGAVYADQTWTGFVGETVPEEHARIFEIVSGARDAAVEFLREQIRARRSIRGAEVDDVSRGVIERAGYGEQFTTRTGHSIGEEVHGNGANIDNLETPDARRIIPRTCFSIEPGIYQPNLFGVRSEIDVYVGDDEIEVTGQPIQTEIVPIFQL
ncbi:MAG TPA: M24 family metallopeptidase [Pyrinomonadaceae bacterium]|nr:M24 family metallopeptidase [Pyrinomonadaceae bacterium]